MYSGNTEEKESSFAQMWKKDYRGLIEQWEKNTPFSMGSEGKNRKEKMKKEAGKCEKSKTPGLKQVYLLPNHRKK